MRSIEAITGPASDPQELYLKLIDYKRSIGTTQWTVLSIFVTASEAVLVFSVAQPDVLAAILTRLFGVAIYWLGFFLFNRYRNLNREVARYLRDLEQGLGFEFQQRLDAAHARGVSTRTVLLVAGLLYAAFAAILSLL